MRGVCKSKIVPEFYHVSRFVLKRLHVKKHNDNCYNRFKNFVVLSDSETIIKTFESPSENKI